MSSPSALLAGRAAAESLMTDMCTVARPTGVPVLNETTQEYESATTTVYTGPCQLQSGATMSTVRGVGDALVLANRLTVKVPLSASGFQTGDKVTVTAAGDSQLVNAVYTVRSISDKSHATCRRLEVEET